MAGSEAKPGSWAAASAFDGLALRSPFATMAAAGCSPRELDAQLPWQVGRRAPHGNPASALAAPGARPFQPWLRPPQPRAERSAASKGPSSEAWKGGLSIGYLHAHLADLQSEDPAHVIVVRGVHKMGSRVETLLTSYCSEYGEVLRVLRTGGYRKGGSDRLRPGSLAFVVMDSGASARRVLAQGARQLVGGFRVLVQHFRERAAVPPGGGCERLRGPSLPCESDWSPVPYAPDYGDDGSLAAPKDLQPGPCGKSRGWASNDSEDLKRASNFVAAMAAGMQAAATPAAGSDCKESPQPASPLPPDWSPPTWSPPAWLPHSRPAVTGAAAQGPGEVLEQLNEVVEIISRASEAAAFTGRRFSQALVLLGAAQQQLHRVLAQCQHQTAQLSQQVQGQVQSLQKHYAQVREVQCQVQTIQTRYAEAREAAAQVARQPASGPAARGLAARSGDLLGASGAASFRGAAPLPRTWSAEAAIAASQAACSTAAAPLDVWKGSLAGPGAAAAEASAASPEPCAAGAAQAGGTAAVAAPPTPVAAPPPAAPPPAAPEGSAGTGLAQPQPAPGQAHLVNSPHARVPAQSPTLADLLTQLSVEDPGRVFIVRRLSRMAFRAEELLRRHFSQYGAVRHVLLVHSKVKPFRNASLPPRTRPGSLGFIVMAAQDSVEQILALGEEQAVAGFQISLQRFQRYRDPERVLAASSAGSATTTAGRCELSSGSSVPGSELAERGSQASGGRGGSPSESPQAARSGSSAKAKDTSSGEGGSTDSQLAEAESSESGSGTERAPSDGRALAAAGPGEGEESWAGAQGR